MIWHIADRWTLSWAFLSLCHGIYKSRCYLFDAQIRRDIAQYDSSPIQHKEHEVAHRTTADWIVHACFHRCRSRTDRDDWETHRSRTNPRKIDSCKAPCFLSLCFQSRARVDGSYSSKARRLYSNGDIRCSSYCITFSARIDLLLHLVEVSQENSIATRHKANITECIRKVITAFARIPTEKKPNVVDRRDGRARICLSPEIQRELIRIDSGRRDLFVDMRLFCIG